MRSSEHGNRLKLRKSIILPASIAFLPLLVFSFQKEILDSDYQAHILWARQTLETGRSIVTENAVFDDPGIYYPNTVPKPLVFLQIFLLELIGGGILHVIFTSTLGILLLFFTASSIWKKTKNAAPVLFGTVLMGFHPVFLFLTLSGSPVILFLLLCFISTMSIRVFSPAALFCATLVRPEGSFYLAGYSIQKRKFGLLLFIPLAACIWLIMNRIMAGDALWSVREVRYVVSAMDYPSPNLLTFWVRVLQRAVLVTGPVLLFALLRKNSGKYPFILGSSVNILFLWISLAFGSLVLHRYLDQVFLLCIPWAVAGLYFMVSSYKPVLKYIVLTVAFLFPMSLWPSFLDTWRYESLLIEKLDSIVMSTDDTTHRIAVNELLVPRIAIANDIIDVRKRFVALNRAIAENASLDSLCVDRILIAPHPVYLPRGTSNFLLSEPLHVTPETLAVWQ